MRATDFQEGCPGRLVETPAGVSAFVPNPLPPDCLTTFSARLMKAHGDARHEVGRLERSVRFSNVAPWLFTRPLMQREAYYSSLMEGTYTTPEQLAFFEESDPGEPARSGAMQTREVMNYVSAIDRGCRMVADGASVGSHLIRTLHRTLLWKVGANDEAAGKFRTLQNYIGRRIDGIQGARFVPPPPHEVGPAMTDLERYIASLGMDGDMPLFVGMALAHYQFEAIHPFEDGNGRIGRLLVPLILVEKGVLADPLLHISPSVEKRREEYVDHMLAVSQRGDWEGWILFFLTMMREAAQDAIGTADALGELRSKYMDLVRTPRMSGLLQTLIDGLFERPSITFGQAAEKLGVTHAQASTHVRRLESLGILREITGGTRYLRFIATEILDTVYRRA